jgi:outer membrane protein assembly factor BamB
LHHNTEVKWNFTTGDSVDGTPILSPDGATIYVGSFDNRLYAINAADGKEKWNYTTGGFVESSYGARN